MPGFMSELVLKTRQAIIELTENGRHLFLYSRLRKKLNIKNSDRSGIALLNKAIKNLLKSDFIVIAVKTKVGYKYRMKKMLDNYLKEKIDSRIPRIISIKMKKGLRPKFDVYIGRQLNYPKANFKRSKWANPFTLSQYGISSLEMYENHVRNSPELMDSLSELTGKILGCWCKPGPCHGDILIKLWKEKFLEDS